MVLCHATRLQLSHIRRLGTPYTNIYDFSLTFAPKVDDKVDDKVEQYKITVARANTKSTRQNYTNANVK